MKCADCLYYTVNDGWQKCMWDFTIEDCDCFVKKNKDDDKDYWEM